MPNPTPLSTDEFLKRYTSQASAPQPVAQTGKALSAEEFAARFTAQSTPPPAPAPETQGGVFSPSSPTDTPIQAGIKTALNLPGSAWNFAKGLVQTMNPVEIAKNIRQIPGEYAALKEEGGGLGSVAKELPGATYEGLVPQAARSLIRGDIEGAQKSVTEDPVGSVAPFVIGARQGAKVIDRATQGRAQATMKDYVQNIDKNVGKPIPRGTGTNLGGMVDTAIEKTGQLVTKPVGAVASGIGEGISTGTRFGVSRATGLQPETITQVQKNPQAFTKENMAKADRADLANEVKTGLDARIEALDDTGSGYQNIRRSGAPVTVDRNWLDDVIRETTGLEVKKGKLTTTGSASIRDSGDVRALQSKYDLWKPIFSRGSMTADEYLNFRADMAGLAKLDREVSKSKPLENLSNVMRGKFNTEYRKQLKGLEEMDADFSAQSTELKLLRKGILDKNDNLTDTAINRISNATGKGKDQQLARLEEIAPGISQKIKVMKAIEDIQNASGIKVGTYDRAALLGGSFVFGGPIPAIITAVMTSPSVAVPMLRQYGLLKNAKAVNAVVQALKDSAGKVNAIPSTLDMDVKKLEGMKVPMGLAIEDVSKKIPKPNLDKHGTPIDGKHLADPVEGGIYYHGTIKENKASLLSEGFNVASNKKGFAEQSEAFYVGAYGDASMYGNDMVGVRVRPGQKVKTLDSSSVEWRETVGRSTGKDMTSAALKELRSRGYDAVNLGNEIEILNPSKFEIVDATKTKSLFEQVTGESVENYKERTTLGTKPKAQDSLAQEARKYKTAEEFVKEFQKRSFNPFGMDDTKIPKADIEFHDAFMEYAQKPEIQKLYEAGKNDIDVLTDIWKKAQGKSTLGTKAPTITESQVVDFIKKWTRYDNMINRNGANLSTFDRLKNEITPELQKELSKYKPKEPLTLYRFQEKGRKTPELSSWSKDQTWVEDMAEFPGRNYEVLKRTFTPDEILVDIERIPSKVELTDIGEVIVKTKDQKSNFGR